MGVREDYDAAIALYRAGQHQPALTALYKLMMKALAEFKAAYNAGRQGQYVAPPPDQKLSP